MFCTIAGAFSWLCIATKMSWPVSSTHSLVGSIVGLGLAFVGKNSLNYTTLWQLGLSWITSPLFGGIFAYILQSIISKKILCKKYPHIEASKYMHYFTGFTVFILSSFILMDGPKVIRLPFYVYIYIHIIVISMLYHSVY